MSRRGLVVILILAATVIAGLAYLAATFNLSALEEPTEFEVTLATRAKHWLVPRLAAREPLPPEPTNDALSVMNGFMQYGGSCASCHGQDGTTPSRIGLSMYPRVPGLGSPDVQQYSNRELFWIIKHGIRLTGMPGFGAIHSDEQIWHLVHYVRSLGGQPDR
jgi:mono/diheme cytochrome c family protein